MGWCDDSGTHEGYIVGLVRDGYRWRELTSADDADIADLKMLQIGCDCGWRSPRIAAPHLTNYMPCIVLTSPEFEELAHRLWHEHVSGGALRFIEMPWSHEARCLMPFEQLRQIREEAEP